MKSRTTFIIYYSADENTKVLNEFKLEEVSVFKAMFMMSDICESIVDEAIQFLQKQKDLSYFKGSENLFVFWEYCSVLGCLLEYVYDNILV